MSGESLVSDKVNGFDYFFHFPKFQLYMYMYRYLNFEYFIPRQTF